MKVVLNRDVGGFGFSNTAFEMLIQLGFSHIHEKDEAKEDFNLRDLKIIIFEETEDDLLGIKYGILQNDFEDEDLRSHPLVVQVVEELGKRAWGGSARLEIAEIPSDIDWRIDIENGFERVIDWDTGERIL
ncbi:hypothetical protein LCGC14_1401510 [marine sediment metagenome]|uniref:Uncharacterized protein n=1 Tax=marine sediment metagenome TaxID=412755 RepID=A0A0F9MCJ0_9ZZZZ